jgi:transcriptional regulator with XRE-family HTH domain
MNQQNIVGEEVRRIRDRLGITQDALATRCNLVGWDVSRATISKIEAGLRRVIDAEVTLLAKALRVDMAELYPRELDEILDIVRQGRSNETG